MTYTHRVAECKYASSTRAVVMRTSVIHTHGPVFIVCIFMLFKHQCKPNSNCATPLLFALQHCVRSNPLGKVIDLMTELSAKIQKEGEDEAKAYDEYVQWCHNAVVSWCHGDMVSHGNGATVSWCHGVMASQ